MSNLVTIKGTKSGIILVVDGKVPFDELKTEIADKFREASDFLGSSRMGLIIRGREMTEDEQDEVAEIIETSSKLKISCIIDEASRIEDKFVRALKQCDTAVSDSHSGGRIESAEEELDRSSARIYYGNLRSGQDISSEESIIVLGDVKPGANVTSYGSIFILGELRGNAFAGALGDKNAVIMAHELDPLQVRIADAIAISPDAEKGPKLKIKKKKILDNANEPEVAYIENGHIVKTHYGASFLRQFYKI